MIHTTLITLSVAAPLLLGQAFTNAENSSTSELASPPSQQGAIQGLTVEQTAERHNI